MPWFWNAKALATPTATEPDPLAWTVHEAPFDTVKVPALDALKLSFMPVSSTLVAVDDSCTEPFTVTFAEASRMNTGEWVSS